MIRYRVPFFAVGRGTAPDQESAASKPCSTRPTSGSWTTANSFSTSRPPRTEIAGSAIYAAFDYKKGKGLASRIDVEGARFLFPEFVHDVVWNHALCTMKEEVERKHAPPPNGN